MPIFRSRHQAELLSVLLLHPNRDYTVSELARALHVPLSTLHREAQRLERAGIVTSRTVGRARLLRANTGNRLLRPLTDLITATFGPHTVVAEEFRTVPGVERLLIFGSWAARYHGDFGPPPNDIDVLIVGRPDRSMVYDAADRAQDRLDLPVNPTICSPTRWSDPADTFIQQVRSSPSLDLTDTLNGA
jgi:DNA-binding transcriptional ArsR family regulator